MNAKNNKRKKGYKAKLSDDLANICYYKNNFDENNNNKKNQMNKGSNNMRTKSSSEIEIYKENNKVKRVKFKNIDVVEIENWKKYNLILTAEENIEELLSISNAKKGKEKNISCTCIII